MKKTLASILIVFLSLALVNCTDEETVSSPATIAPVRVDLQQGFEDKWVRVYFNRQLYFTADLTPSVPLAGPIASFSTYLPRDSNLIQVTWYGHQPNSLYRGDSATFYLGDAELYFMELRLQNDLLRMVVQENPFLYL